MLKGISPNDGFFDAAWKSAEERIKGDSNLCIVPDLESGYPIIMTVEERDDLVKLYESFKSVSPLKVKTGTIIVFGTSGESNLNDFKDLFYNTEE